MLQQGDFQHIRGTAFQAPSARTVTWWVVRSEGQRLVEEEDRLVAAPAMTGNRKELQHFPQCRLPRAPARPPTGDPTAPRLPAATTIPVPARAHPAASSRQTRTGRGPPGRRFERQRGCLPCLYAAASACSMAASAPPAAASACSGAALAVVATVTAARKALAATPAAGHARLGRVPPPFSPQRRTLPRQSTPLGPVLQQRGQCGWL